MSGPGGTIDNAPNKSDDNTQWLLTGDLPCLGDAYNLRGLVGPIVKCPECGHLNDLRDPSPWRKQDLPLGITQREHWPASAALCFLLIPIAIFFCSGFVLAMEWGILGLLPAILVVLTTIGIWANQCRKFIASARSRRWAFTILAGTHFAPALTLFGLVGILLLIESLNNVQPTASTEFAAGMIVALPIGLVMFAWLKMQLKQHDNAAVFRVGWQNYRVPTAAPDHDSAGQ